MNELIKLLAEQAGFSLRVDNVTDDEMVRIYQNADKVKKFAELIVAECAKSCDEVARDADAMTKSKFVTDAGRMLHEGMWGGAQNCKATILGKFGSNDE